MTLRGHILSPVKHLYLKNSADDYNTEQQLIYKIVDMVNFLITIKKTSQKVNNVYFIFLVYRTKISYCKCRIFRSKRKKLPTS